MFYENSNLLYIYIFSTDIFLGHIHLVHTTNKKNATFGNKNYIIIALLQRKVHSCLKYKLLFEKGQ